MLKRAGTIVLLLTLLAAPMATLASAQADETLTIVALDTYQPLVDAWIAGYAATEPGYTIAANYATSGEDVLAQASEANVIILDTYEEEPAITFECGFVSKVYLLLPELGGRYLASNSCGGEMDPKDAAAKAFLAFAVSPDGQQIAIDQGALPEVVEVVDQAGETVRVPQPVRRIATPYSMSTYYVYAVGAGDQLVVANYLGVNNPASQDVMRRIDPDYDVLSTAVETLGQQEANIEELAALQPDLILASARTSWLDAAGELGVPIIRFEGETPERLQEAMTLIGSVLGPNAAYWAERYNAYYEDTLAEILAQTSTVENRQRVYFSGSNPLRVAGGDMYQTDMIEAAGGISVAAELTTGYWNDVNLEQVALWDPDVIFYPPYGGANAEAFTESEEWAIIRAVQEGAVYGIPKLIAPWDTPVPDSLLGIIWMAETLYPEQVTLACEAEVTTFYNTFYDYAIAEEEVQSLCR